MSQIWPGAWYARPGRLIGLRLWLVTQQLGQVFNDGLGYFRFRHRRQRMGAGVVQQHHLIVVGAHGLLREVGDQQRQLLAQAFGFGEFQQILAFGGEADAERGRGQAGDGGEDVGFSSSSRLGGVSPFLILWAEGFLTR